MAGLDLDPFGGKDPFASIGHIPGLDIGGSAQRRTRAEFRRPLPPEQSESLGRQVLNTGASGLNYILGTLDKPGQAVRGVLAGNGASSLKHLIPFSDSLGITTDADHVSGRDLTNKLGITSRHDDGWGAWGLGLAADIATDPLTYATFGAKSALTPAGQTLSRGGHLRGWSREALLRGFNATEPELLAAGRTAADVRHLADRGLRIASPEAVAAGASANQPLAGLVRIGVPFGPGRTFGSGPVAQSVARRMDRAANFLQFGNPIGRSIGALFDPTRHEAVDAITQQGARRYLDPELQALKQQGRNDAYGVLSQLDPLVRSSAHPEEAITEAARSVAENVPFLANPAIAPQVAGVAGDIRGIGARQLAEARAAGLPLADLSDPYVNYVHRQALDVNHAALQLGNGRTTGNLYPVASGSNIHRDDLLRGIPGGTARINNWWKRFAGTGDIPGTAAQIHADMVNDLHAGGRGLTLTPALDSEFNDRAFALAERLSRSNERHLAGKVTPEGLPLFSPNLAGDVIQRGAQHARTVASARAAIGTIGDVARRIDVGNPNNLIPVPDVLRRLGLRTYRADRQAGAPMEGALVQAYRALARQGAGLVDPYLMGRVRNLRRATANYGLTPEHAEQILKAHQKWATPEVLKSPLGFLDSATNAFKALAYPIWIPAHVRNAATAATNNLRSGTRLSDYLDQLKVMTGRGTRDLSSIHPSLAGLPPDAQVDWLRRHQFASGNIFGGHGLGDDVADSAVDALLNTASGAGANRFTPIVPGSNRVGPTGNLARDTADLVFRQGLANSLTSTGRALAGSLGGLLDRSRRWGQSLVEHLGVKGVGGARADVLPAVRAGRIAGTNIEDFFRGAQWNRLVKEGASPEEAARAVNTLHFDYDALTQTEKNVMRRIVPFYTFARKNLPLQAETALTRPGILQAQYKPFHQEEPGQQGYVPQYLQSGVTIPTGPEQDGRRQYISKLGLPAEEAFERLHFKNGLPDLQSTALDYLGQLNPLIKAPLEQLFDTQFHTQRRLSDLKATGAAGALGRMFGDENPQLLGQIMSNSPFTRFFTTADKLLDDRKSLPAKLANLLTGVRVTDVDTSKQRAIDLRNALEGIMAGHPNLSRYQSFYVKPEDVGSLTPEEIQLMRLYSGIQDAARKYAEEKRKIGVKK